MFGTCCASSEFNGLVNAANVSKQSAKVIAINKIEWLEYTICLFISKVTDFVLVTVGSAGCCLYRRLVFKND